MKRLKVNTKKGKKVVRKKRNKTVKDKDKIEEIVKESGVYKKPEFRAYVIWKSLPAMLRGMKVENLNKLGINDDLSISMLEIKTQTEFAKKFKIKRATCSEWNNILVDDNLIHDNILRWAKMITPNVIMALGRTAVRTGKAQEVMAWEKLIEDYTDKTETIHGFTKEALQDIQSGVRDLIKSEKKK